MIYDIAPMAKPRMTKSDEWKRRPIVMRYRAFKDEVRLKSVEIPQPCKIVFNIKMPKSWSKKKKLAHIGKPHKQTPDIDNLLKGLMDAIYEDDAHIWAVLAIKQWSDVPSIEVNELRGLNLDVRV